MAEFRRALQLKPKLVGSQFFPGGRPLQIGSRRQAIPYLKAAAQAAPQSANIWSWLATAQEMSGQSQAEVETLKRGLESQPRNVDLYYLLGRAYEKLGKEQVASLLESAPIRPAVNNFSERASPPAVNGPSQCCISRMRSSFRPSFPDCMRKRERSSYTLTNLKAHSKNFSRNCNFILNESAGHCPQWGSKANRRRPRGSACRVDKGDSDRPTAGQTHSGHAGVRFRRRRHRTAFRLDSRKVKRHGVVP